MKSLLLLVVLTTSFSNSAQISELDLVKLYFNKDYNSIVENFNQSKNKEEHQYFWTAKSLYRLCSKPFFCCLRSMIKHSAILLLSNGETTEPLEVSRIIFAAHPVGGTTARIGLRCGK